jgi:hypothetical protein
LEINMKKITESQLIEQARGLRAYLSDAAVVSGDGTPVTSGNGAPVQAGATPAPAAPIAGANPWEGKDPAKAAAWAKLSPQVQKKIGMADPTDNIIVSRMAKGEFGGLFGGGATDANPDGTAKTVPGAAANAAAATATTADLAQLKTLIAQLTSMSGQGAKIAPGEKRTPAEIQASKDLGNFAGESLNESMGRLIAKLTVLEDAPQTATMPATPAAAPAGDKAAIIKQIQDIMARINSNNENPTPDIAAALGDAQKAIDTASAAPAAPAADQSAKVPANRDAMPFNSAFADARAKGEKTFQWKGKSYTTDLAKPGTAPAPGAGAKMPAPADSRSAYEKVMPNFLGGKSAPTAPTAKAPAPAQGAKKPAAVPTNMPQYDTLGNPVQETTSYRQEESLARIIDLARR